MTLKEGNTYVMSTGLAESFIQQMYNVTDTFTDVNISSTNFGSLVSAVTTPSGLMSTDLQKLINFIDFIIIQSVVILSGIAANGLSIYSFAKIGLGDTVTISFFALSLTDMCCLLVAVYNWLCYTLYRSPVSWPVDMFTLMYLGVWYFQAFYDVSMLITTYTAVQKCCCIALPFHFRSVFTKRRTFVMIVCIVLLCGAAYAPVFATQGLQKVSGISNNTSTSYTVWFSSNREEIIGINDIIIRVFLQNACEVIVLSCLFILTNTLRRQYNFRRSVSLHSFSDVSNDASQNDIVNNNQQGASHDKVNKVSAKELQVIKSVTLLSAVFVTCNMPRIVLSLARVIVPELDTYRRFHNIHLTLQMFRRVVEVSGTSANFIILYKFNYTFREAIVNLFQCCKAH
ncbi:G-protein coupled receptor C02B8.5 [Biomphalaria glabrata]|uniref:Uncharacterized protein LOC129927714 n=1 Tax=Biomphalaria glabrata TaxID=6526 RepID=A0A9W3B3E7_BIOGL|nr:uncharacterized protein LOC129927714 [Biomphalaria glabrata]KAI8734274.1 putative G-protein coupled receptor C02B8.5 [Biomphalaria glabrata]